MAGKRFKYSPEQDRIIRERYPDESAIVIAEVTGLTPRRVMTRAFFLGVKHSDAYTQKRIAALKINGEKSRFQQGNDAKEKRKKNRARREKRDQPVGTITTVDGGWKRIKVASTGPYNERWQVLHRYIWEKANGPIPDGFSIVFKDGNRNNVVLENLECILTADLMKRNSWHNLPEELQEIVILRGVLTKEIKKHES